MTYIILAFLLVINVVNLVYVLGLFQQEHYQVRPFFKQIKKYFTRRTATYFLYVASLFVILLAVTEEWYFGLIIIILLGGYLNFNKKLIIKFKMTKRMMRLLTVYALALGAFCLTPYYNIFLMVWTIFAPFVVLMFNGLLLPFENKIKRYYLKQAILKLTTSNSLVIGITGSFGKTSVKNFTYEILKSQYLCLKSPHSYNTPMGLAKTINGSSGLEDYLVLEMGARYVNDIRELALLYQPHIGVITEIGAQHLSTLGNIETVLKTKAAILDSPRLEKIILNYDNPYLKNISIDEKIKVISVGLKEKAMYQVKDVELSLGKTKFSLYYLDDLLCQIEAKLLGYHNILNLAISVVIAYEQKVPLEDIIYQVAKIENIKHRLSYQSFDNIEIIDDAFNANYKGFVNALDVLKMSSHYKILITPGLVDLGESMKEYNQKLALNIIESCDRVCLIKNEASLYIEQMFHEHKFQQYFVYKSFKEAYADIIKTYQETKITVLIENDLPDHFL